MRLVPSQL